MQRSYSTLIFTVTRPDTPHKMICSHSDEALYKKYHPGPGNYDPVARVSRLQPAGGSAALHRQPGPDTGDCWGFNPLHITSHDTGGRERESGHCVKCEASGHVYTDIQRVSKTFGSIYFALRDYYLSVLWVRLWVRVQTLSMWRRAAIGWLTAPVMGADQWEPCIVHWLTTGTGHSGHYWSVAAARASGDQWSVPGGGASGDHWPLHPIISWGNLGTELHIIMWPVGSEWFWVLVIDFLN